MGALGKSRLTHTVNHLTNEGKGAGGAVRGADHAEVILTSSGVRVLNSCEGVQITGSTLIDLVLNDAPKAICAHLHGITTQLTRHEF